MLQGRISLLVLLAAGLAITAALYPRSGSDPILDKVQISEKRQASFKQTEIIPTGSVTFGRIWLNNDEPELLRLSGYFEGDNPTKQFEIVTHISDQPDGFEEGYSWYVPMSDERYPPGIFPFIVEYKRFPLSAENFHIRLYFLDKSTRNIAFRQDFKIANPFRKKGMKWKAETLPATRKIAPLEATLNKVETGFTSPDNVSDHPVGCTRLTLRLQENGKRLQNWGLRKVSFSAASGLSFPYWESMKPSQKEEIEITEGGTLWKDEGPWKVHITMTRIGDFRPEEFLETEQMPIPPEGEFVSSPKHWEIAGIPIHFLGISGGNAAPPDAKAHIPKSPALHFQISREARAKGVLLQLLSITDENGNDTIWNPTVVDQKNFYFQLPPNQARPSKVRFKGVVIHEQKEIEFIVQPTFLKPKGGPSTRQLSFPASVALPRENR